MHECRRNRKTNNISAPKLNATCPFRQIKENLSVWKTQFVILGRIFHTRKCDGFGALLYIQHKVYPLPSAQQVWRWCHRQSHSNGTQTMYHVLNCFQESLVEEILRSFWGNQKWGWGPTEAEHNQAKICNACDFWINIFSCTFYAQRFFRQREKNLLVRNKTINSNNRPKGVRGRNLLNFCF